MKALKRLSILAVLIGSVVIIVFYADLSTEQSETGVFENVITYTYEKKQEQAEVGIPMRLRIPNIGVDAVIEGEGLTSDGAMGIPESMENVGWFKLGKRPGEIGSAVIAGHYGMKNGKSSVFDELHKLNKGDKVYVEDNNEVVATFVVRESLRYDSDADTLDVFESNDGKAHLNIITCDGIWDDISKSYPTRLVVFTDME